MAIKNNKQGEIKLSAHAIAVLKKAADNGDNLALQKLLDAGIEYEPKAIELSDHAKEVLYNSGKAELIDPDFPHDLVDEASKNADNNKPINTISDHAISVLIDNKMNAWLEELGLTEADIQKALMRESNTNTAEGGAGGSGGAGGAGGTATTGDIDINIDDSNLSFEQQVQLLKIQAEEQAKLNEKAGYVLPPEILKVGQKFSRIQMLAIKTQCMLLYNLSEFPMDQILEILKSLRDRLRIQTLAAQTQKKGKKYENPKKYRQKNKEQRFQSRKKRGKTWW